MIFFGNDAREEETLDPADWNNLKEIAAQMMVDMTAYLQTIAEKPVWQKPPAEVVEHFSTGLPNEPQSMEQVYEEFRKYILPYNLGNIHPRFWSWVMGSGTMQGMLADMLASGMNTNTGIGDHSPRYVDQQVLNWCKEMMGFPASSSGLLLNGASEANLNALIVARNTINKSIRQKGIQSLTGRLIMYASTETHSCIQKAAEIIGIGSEGLRNVWVNENFEMDILQLEELIQEDIAEGNIPFCVVANAGTVNTGAIDPLDEIARVCRKYKLWFHVDGAFGALVKLLPEYENRVKTISLADSVAFDLHKWMHIQYEAAVVLVNDAGAHRHTYTLQPDYILNYERGIAAGPELNSNFGFNLSRGFKALKVWMLLKEQGIDKFRRLIRQNIRQAAYLATLVKQAPDLELMAPANLNIVCFRYNPGKMSRSQLNIINKEILLQLQEQGIAAPSSTFLNENYCLRVAITNHRSKKEDFETLATEVSWLGKQLAQSLKEEYLKC
jgi:glutamate/tyrosine decarboxylase-like PLP-dependent enzyme